MFNDDKTEYLNYYGSRESIEFVISPIRSVFFPLFLIYSIFFFNKPNAILVRYLSDRKSLILSVVLFLSRQFSFIIASSFKIKIIWFCHNIDKETDEYHPTLIKINRNYLCKYSEKIYVMDKLLIESAIKQFPRFAHKIDDISFGIRTNNYRRSEDLDNSLYEILKKLKEDNKDSLIGFCPTNFGDKYYHINYAPKLVTEAKKNGLNVYILLIGELNNYLENNLSIKDNIANNPNVILIDKFVDYDASVLSEYIDFYWRGLNDQSISYSLYEAATQRTPTLALDVGFIGKAVNEYNLGSTVDLHMDNLSNAFENLASWDESYAIKFLDTHSWSYAIKKIKKIL